MCQPDLITKLEKTFHEGMEDLKIYKTPASPGEIIIKSTEEEELVDSEAH
jgi:hypothetical protein